MRISRRWLAFCPLKLGVSVLTTPLAILAASPPTAAPAPMLLTQAAQSAADARLRQLLEQKTREVDGAGKSPPASAPAATPVIAPSPASTNNEATVRQLLDQKASELNAQPQTAVKETKAQERARRKAEKEAQKRAVEETKRRAQEEALRTKEAARVAEENAKAAARSQQEAEKAAKEKALAEQKAREEQERQDRINKIKADLVGQSAPKPVTTPAPVAVPAVTAPVAPAAPDSEAARRLLEQRIRELDSATVPAPAPARRVAEPMPTPVAVTAPAPASTAPEGATDSARALLEQKTREIGGSPAPAATATARRPASSVKPAKSGPAVPVVAQPAAPLVESPLAKTKQEKLAELLEAYRHNLITPADYHNSRAKILAEP
jgi:hypothetical protein